MKHPHLYTPIILLILIFVAVLGIISSADAQKVHALLIIMDDSLDIRQTVDINRLRIKKMLQLLDVSPEIWQADDRQIRPEHINKWVKNRRVASKDTIFVYYSGHGHIDQKARHYLDLDVQNPAFSLLRSDLVKELSGKRCRLKMLITDTCSNEIQILSRATSSATVVSRKRPYAEDLFLKHSGLLDITAASPRQYAWGNNQIGGYFTAALIESFTAKSDTNKDRFLSWKEVFSATRDGTQKLFEETTFLSRDLLKMHPIGQKTQTPKIYSTLPKPIKSIRGTVVTEPIDRERIVLFGHEYSREEIDALIMRVAFGGIVFIFILVLAKFVLKKGKRKRGNETTQRNLPNRHHQQRKNVNKTTEGNPTSKNNLSPRKLRRTRHRLSMKEKDLREQLKSENLNHRQTEDQKKQLRKTLTQLEKNVISELKNIEMGGGRSGHLERQLTNIRKRKKRLR